MCKSVIGLNSCVVKSVSDFVVGRFTIKTEIKVEGNHLELGSSYYHSRLFENFIE